MNIEQFWPTQPEPYALNLEIVQDLVARRLVTTRGFMAVESAKGLVVGQISLNSCRGQDTARLLMFRALEEVMESHFAMTPPHRKEEAIDAINYLWTILLLDPARFTSDLIVAEIVGSIGSEAWFADAVIGPEEITAVTSCLCGQVCDLFRNRSWMSHAQDIYFNGNEQLLQSILEATNVLLAVFKDFDEFCRYYIAKDGVLQFRLRSHY